MGLVCRTRQWLHSEIEHARHTEDAVQANWDDASDVERPQLRVLVISATSKGVLEPTRGIVQTGLSATRELSVEVRALLLVKRGRKLRVVGSEVVYPKMSACPSRRTH